MPELHFSLELLASESEWRFSTLYDTTLQESKKLILLGLGASSDQV